MRYFSVSTILILGYLVSGGRIRLLSVSFTLDLLGLVKSHHCFEDIKPVFYIRSYSCIVVQLGDVCHDFIESRLNIILEVLFQIIRLFALSLDIKLGKPGSIKHELENF